LRPYIGVKSGVPDMQTQSAIFDEIAKLMTEAAGAADGVRREAETVFKGKLQSLLADMELVTRDEFEAVREMARAAREENEALKARLDALENR
jgi:BMFP domain-containing protein YqiC